MTSWPGWSPQGRLRTILRYAGLLEPWGLRIHLALAICYLFLLPIETLPKDIAWLILALWTTLRLPLTWRDYMVLHDRLLWLVVAWAGWHALSLTWTGNPVAGLDELRAFRVVLTPLFLWHVLGRTPLLIGAFLAGVFFQNLVQAAQGVELFGITSPNERLEGWLHPILTGAFCVAALCWHLSALISRPGGAAPRRSVVLISYLGLAAVAAGLVFTGSRGPWLSAALAVPLVLLIAAIRWPQTRRTTFGLVGAAVLGMAVIWPMAGGFVRMRVEQAISDLAAAEQGDYQSDVGHRLARWSAAGTVFLHAPVIGVGSGGYGRAAGEPTDADVERAPHAHSVYMHELATVGAVGFMLLTGIVLVTVCRLWQLCDSHLYAAGTLGVLASWLVGAVFDAYQLNGHMLGLFMVVVTLALAPRAQP